jgi:hypothetical protein
MGRVPIITAFAVFLLYFTNVTLGAFGGTAFLGDVAEMLTLLLAVVLFVAGILIEEAARAQRREHDTDQKT